MIKNLRVVLSFFLIFVASLNPQTFNSSVNNTNQKSSFDGIFGYPHIKINTNFNEANYSNTDFSNYYHPKKYVGETIINWSKYAKNWDEFIKYYQIITFFAQGGVKASNYLAKSFSNIKIKTSDISFQEEWQDMSFLKKNENYMLVNLSNKVKNTAFASIFYDAIRDENFIKIRFLLYSEPVDGAYFANTSTSWLKITHGVIESNYDLEQVKKKLSDNLAKKINLISDYSGSIEDENNVKKETEAINNVLEATFNSLVDEDYQVWKQYIQPFAFDNKSKQATITFKFLEPNTQKWVIWTFKTPITIILTKDYWGKSLSERLHITPGKIVNPYDSTKGMIDDIGLQLEPDKVSKNYGGTLQYHTSANISFDGLNDSSEWVTVNGKKIEVLNNKFVFQMDDKRITKQDEKAVNSYDIVLYHDDGKYQEQYQVKYIINNDVPNLQAKWYAWNPDSNPLQKQLIEPTLKNGKLNPNYDAEINLKTGTKTQIIWVKNKSQYPFALDPLNEQGEVISNSEEYDLGFIAEGSVSGMGVQQLFNNKDVKEVYRQAVTNELKESKAQNEFNKLVAIQSDKENQYWSWEGIWHYIIKAKDDFNYEKYVLIGQQYQDKYLKFLDVLNDHNAAVAFWDTIHGSHLKNYLIKVKNLDSNSIDKLTFEQVSSHWKEYTSDVIAQRVSVVSAIDSNSIDFISNNENLNELKKAVLNDIAISLQQQNQTPIASTSNSKDKDKELNALNPTKEDEILKLNTMKLHKQNVIIISIIVASLVSTFCVFAFFRYRFKKGIGGKKRKKQ